MKMTPVTVPMAAVPTARMPAEVKLIPTGSRGPPESIPYVPPRFMLSGRVVFRSNDPLDPTMRAGTTGAQVPEVDGSGVEGGVFVGVGDCVGAGAGGPSVDGAPPSGRDVSLSHLHPPSVVAATAKAPLNSSLRYLSSFIRCKSPHYI